MNDGKQLDIGQKVISKDHEPSLIQLIRYIYLHSGPLVPSRPPKTGPYWELGRKVNFAP